MRIRIIWFLCVLLFFSSIFGQGIREERNNSGRIIGQVTEAATGKPIVGANVLLLGTMLGAATDNQGRFVISRVPPSTYTIMVSAIGYKKEEKTIHVRPEAETDLRFSLQETVLLMDGIAVTASRYQQSLNDIPMSLSLVPSVPRPGDGSRTTA